MKIVLRILPSILSLAFLLQSSALACTSKIKNKEVALSYARKESTKKNLFLELQSTINNIIVPKYVLNKYNIALPNIKETVLKNGEKAYIISRYVVLKEKIKHLTNYKPTGNFPLASKEITEIGKVKETVSASGNYSYEIERIPVKGFKVFVAQTSFYN